MSLFISCLEGYSISNSLNTKLKSVFKTICIEENLSEIFSVIIEDLEEGSYEFNVYTQDTNGNLSVSQIVAGNVIGDEFILDQNPREVLDYSFEPEGNYVNFYGNAESEFVIYLSLIHI